MQKLRELKGNDIFKLSKILKKINFDVKKIDTKDKNQQQIGIEVLKNLAENAYQAQDEINEFLGSLVGCKGKEFGEKPLHDYLEVVRALKDIPDIADFFKAVDQ